MKNKNINKKSLLKLMLRNIFLKIISKNLCEMTNISNVYRITRILCFFNSFHILFFKRFSEKEQEIKIMI